MKPKRIQRKRTKGWKMPANAVYVGRPSKWGNPFSISGPDANGYWIVSCSGYRMAYDSEREARAGAVRLYRKYLDNEGREPGQIRDAGGAFLKVLASEELRGKDLVCWCAPGEPCHADVLLEVVNA